MFFYIYLLDVDDAVPRLLIQSLTIVLTRFILIFFFLLTNNNNINEENKNVSKISFENKNEQINLKIIVIQTM